MDVFAVDPGTMPGATASATFTINEVAATPTFSLTAGDRYSTDQTLTISDTTPGATVYAVVNPGTAAVAATTTAFTNTGSSPVATTVTGPLNAFTVDAMATAMLEVDGRRDELIELGLARGKKQHDKRETEKKRDWEREKQRLMRSTSKS